MSRASSAKSDNGWTSILLSDPPVVGSGALKDRYIEDRRLAIRLAAKGRLIKIYLDTEHIICWGYANGSGNLSVYIHNSLRLVSSQPATQEVL